MLAKIISGANIGLDAVPITCEVDIASAGLPSFTIADLAQSENILTEHIAEALQYRLRDES